jgi:hypothetical protein
MVDPGSGGPSREDRLLQGIDNEGHAQCRMTRSHVDTGHEFRGGFGACAVYSR